MENKEDFQMTYSAQLRQEVQSIRDKYMPPEEDKLARLRALDASVTKKGSAAAITVGVVGTLLLGGGMSLLMSELGSYFGVLAVPLGLAFGLAGMVIVGMAYPLYRRVVKKERKRIAPEILSLSQELIG